MSSGEGKEGTGETFPADRWDIYMAELWNKLENVMQTAAEEKVKQ